MPRALITHVAHLGVEIVVIIALPRREGSGIRRPYPLQRHRRRPAPRGGSVEIADQIIVPLDVQLGNGDGRLRPELRPPGRVRPERRGVTLPKRRRNQPPRLPQDILVGAGRGDGGGHQGRLARAPAFNKHAVLERAGGGLNKPVGAAIASHPRGGVAQLGHGMTGGAGVAAARPRQAQANLLWLRAGDPEQRDRFRRAEERLALLTGTQLRATFRRGEVQFKSLHRLGGIEQDLQPAGGNLRRRGLVVRLVKKPADFLLVPLARQLRHVLKGEPRFVNLRRRAQIPEIAAIEGKPQQVGFAPEQAAEQPVAQRHGFVPGADRGGELHVQRCVGQADGGG